MENPFSKFNKILEIIRIDKYGAHCTALDWSSNLVFFIFNSTKVSRASGLYIMYNIEKNVIIEWWKMMKSLNIDITQFNSRKTMTRYAFSFLFPHLFFPFHFERKLIEKYGMKFAFKICLTNAVLFFFSVRIRFFRSLSVLSCDAFR